MRLGHGNGGVNGVDLTGTFNNAGYGVRSLADLPTTLRQNFYPFSTPVPFATAEFVMDKCERCLGAAGIISMVVLIVRFCESEVEQ